jgi:hypothetical protein
MSTLPPTIEAIVASFFPGLYAPRRLPCEVCADADICGVYPCPKVGPEDIDTAALEAAKE